MSQPPSRSRVSSTLLPWLFGMAIATIALPSPSQPPPLPFSTPPPPHLPTSLIPISAPQRPALDEQLWTQTGRPGDRQALLTAIDHSLRYLKTPSAATAYQRLAIVGITRSRVQRSLERFRQLVLSARTARELQQAIDREFAFYQSTGKDGRGTVNFTGYYEAVHPASRVRTREFRYPIYRLPANFASWPQPHPTRLQLEGADGLQAASGPLRGLELVWLRDRLDAFLIQVQGSARLTLTDGRTMTVGYAGHTNYPYTGIGRELVKAGKFTLEELTLPRLVDYFKQHPADLDLYLPRNQRFVFFQETGGAPATGSLGVPVTADRSIATDKSLFPPGALALIQTQLPAKTSDGQFQQRPVTQFVLDQDTGGAIKGAGRVDVFMGTGQQGSDRAGLINATGTLYYLLLKPDR